MTTKKEGRVPHGPNVKGMPIFKHNRNDSWRCRVCGYHPNVDKLSGSCIGCGRDFWGNPGKVPEIAEDIHHARESGAR